MSKLFTRREMLKRTIVPVLDTIFLPIILKSPKFLKGARLDLSVMSDLGPTSDTAFRLTDKLANAGVNTLFLNDHSDGRANYLSDISDRNIYGNANFFGIITQAANAQNIDVYAWNVAHRDRFDANNHPEWHVQTANGHNYNDEDGNWVDITHPEFQQHTRSTTKEIFEKIPLVKGSALSEIMVWGWGDCSDSDTYGNFNENVMADFQQHLDQPVSPRDILDRCNSDDPIFAQWLEFRSHGASEFARQIIEQHQQLNKESILTVWIEPDNSGVLRPEWSSKDYGMDIPGQIALQPTRVEIQAAFRDFSRYPNATPEYVRSITEQFRNLYSIAPIVSIPAYAGEHGPITATDFELALLAAIEGGASGLNFYAYHELDSAKWAALKRIYSNI